MMKVTAKKMLGILAFALALQMLVGVSFVSAASIDSPGDVDDFTYETITADPVSIAVLGDAYGLDPVLEIYDPSGTLIRSNDDFGNTTVRIAGVPMGYFDSAILRWSPATNGIHTIRVRGYGSSTGSYLLIMRSENPYSSLIPAEPGDDGGEYIEVDPNEVKE